MRCEWFQRPSTTEKEVRDVQNVSIPTLTPPGRIDARAGTEQRKKRDPFSAGFWPGFESL